MVMKTTRPTDTIAVMGAIAAQSLNGSAQSGWIAAKDFHKFMATVDIGATAVGVVAKIEQATDSGGTGAKDVTGKATTSTGSQGQVIIEFDGEDLDVDNDFDFVRLDITTGGASLVSGVVYGIDPSYGPAADGDAASVLEIIGLDA